LENNALVSKNKICESQNSQSNLNSAQKNPFIPGSIANSQVNSKRQISNIPPNNNIAPIKQNIFNKQFIPEEMKSKNVNNIEMNQPSNNNINYNPKFSENISKKNNDRKSNNQRKSFNNFSKGDGEKKKKQKYTKPQQENKVKISL
jgi:hypothetical protein